MAKDLYASALLDVYGEFLSEKQRTIAAYYYYDDLSLSEISENKGITRQGVRDLIKRAEQQLYRMEKTCGYYHKFSELRRLSEAVAVGDKNSISELLSIIDSL